MCYPYYWDLPSKFLLHHRREEGHLDRRDEDAAAFRHRDEDHRNALRDRIDRRAWQDYDPHNMDQC